MHQPLPSSNLPVRWNNPLPSIKVGNIEVRALEQLPEIPRLPRNFAVDLAWGRGALLEVIIQNEEVITGGVLLANPGERFSRNSFIQGGYASNDISLDDIWTEFYESSLLEQEWRFAVEPLDGNSKIGLLDIHVTKEVDGENIQISSVDTMKDLVEFLDNFKGTGPMFANLADAWEKTRNGECMLLALHSSNPELVQVWLNHEGWGMRVMKLDKGEAVISPNNASDQVAGMIADIINEVASRSPHGAPIILENTELKTTTNMDGVEAELSAWEDPETGLLFSPVRDLHAAARLLSRTTHFTRCTGRHATMHEHARPDLEALATGTEALIMVEGPAGTAGSISITREGGAKRWSFGSWILEDMIPPNIAKKGAMKYMAENLVEEPTNGLKL